MWNSVHCAVQGRSHAKSGTPCQDKTFSLNADGVQVVALADGAGSAKLSHYGADSATQLACAELSRNFDSYFEEKDGANAKRRLISIVSECLGKKAAELGCEKKDLASTLLFVAVKNGRFILAHIGDGVVGYLKDGELKTASQGENGEFANTTVFTTSRDALATMKLIKGELGRIRGFVLMSDGTEASLYDKRTRSLAAVLKSLMELSVITVPERFRARLAGTFESVIRRNTGDDCSIAMIVDDLGGFAGWKNLRDGEKRALLKLGSKSPRRTVRQLDKTLAFLQEERSLRQVAAYAHLKQRLAKKRLEKLCSLNFVETDGQKYKTILIMDREK